MEKVEFFEKFMMLLESKQVTISDGIVDAYWDILKGLRYLDPLLIETSRRTWYKDFQQSIPRFPQASEMLDLHKQIIEKMPIINTKLIIEETKSKKTPQYWIILTKFCTDCFNYLSLDRGSVWDYCEKNKIEIGEDYKNIKNIEPEVFELIADSILGGGRYEIKKVKKEKNRNSINHVSNGICELTANSLNGV